MTEHEHEDLLTQQLDQLLSGMADQEGEISKNIQKIDDCHYLIEDQEYELLINDREAFEYEAFYQRYQDYFEKFDYIVGDWAFEQLRLRGFYQIGTPKVAADQRIETLEDYLNEYCNFGAKYFVIGKVSSLINYPDLADRLRAGKLRNIPTKTSYRPQISKAIPGGRSRKSNKNSSRRNRKASSGSKLKLPSKKVKDDFKIVNYNKKTVGNRSTNKNKQSHQKLVQKSNFVIKQK